MKIQTFNCFARSQADRLLILLSHTWWSRTLPMDDECVIKNATRKSINSEKTTFVRIERERKIKKATNSVLSRSDWAMKEWGRVRIDVNETMEEITFNRSVQYVQRILLVSAFDYVCKTSRWFQHSAFLAFRVRDFSTTCSHPFSLQLRAHRSQNKEGNETKERTKIRRNRMHWAGKRTALYTDICTSTRRPSKWNANEGNEMKRVKQTILYYTECAPMQFVYFASLPRNIAARNFIFVILSIAVSLWTEWNELRNLCGTTVCRTLGRFYVFPGPQHVTYSLSRFA